jgi:hypothetical protein
MSDAIAGAQIALRISMCFRVEHVIREIIERRNAAMFNDVIVGDRTFSLEKT